MSLSLQQHPQPQQQHHLSICNTDPDPIIKKCSKCGKWKVITEFGKHKMTKDGYQYWCKACTSMINKQTYHSRKADPEKYRLYLDKKNSRLKERISNNQPLVKKKKYKINSEYFKLKYRNNMEFQKYRKQYQYNYYYNNKEAIKITQQKYYQKQKSDPVKWNRLIALKKYRRHFGNYKPRKQCSICGDFYPLTPDHFIRQTTSPDGYMGICIKCGNDKNKRHEYLIKQQAKE